METLVGQRVKAFQPGGFKYVGKVLEENEHFLRILDDHTGKVFLLSKSSLMTLEELK